MIDRQSVACVRWVGLEARRLSLGDVESALLGKQLNTRAWSLERCRPLYLLVLEVSVSIPVYWECSRAEIINVLGSEDYAGKRAFEFPGAGLVTTEGSLPSEA